MRAGCRISCTAGELPSSVLEARLMRTAWRPIAQSEDADATAPERNSSLHPSEVDTSSCVSAIRRAGSTAISDERSETDARARTRPCRRASCSPIWMLTRLRSVFKPRLALASRYWVPSSEPRSHTALARWPRSTRRRSLLTAGRPHSPTDDPLIGALRHRPRQSVPWLRRVPASSSVDVRYDARGGPVAVPQSLERLSPTSARVRA
jgi:hypothetical protein